MSSSIRILPPEVQNQIAAGEVVERPASVLKELLENSLDARANFIKVKINKGGLELIQVEDNGEGIAEQDLELALTRHATSKISFFPDLLSISTYGFRGEALPSIASVTQLTLSSRPKQQEIGMAIDVHFGKILQTYPITHPIGTKVKVENLFHNVPARLKFLKTPKTEKNKCIAAFIRESLAHKEVEFELSIDNKEYLHFYKQEDILLRLQKIWPKNITQSLIEFSLEKESLKVYGFTSKPSSIQARGDRIFLYVNKRPVQDKLLLKAIKEAYAGKILRNEFPQTVLFLELPAELVDVNVHPAKTEVRFLEESLVFISVKKALSKALEPQITYSLEVKENISQKPLDNKNSTYSNLLDIESKTQTTSKHLETKEAIPIYLNSFNSSQEENKVTYLGQVEATYLLLKQKDNFILLDQHAVHERILYENLKQRKIEKKQLLLPLSFELSLSEKETINEIFPYLNKCGFQLQLESSILKITAIPSLLSSEQAKAYLEEIISKKIDKFEELLKIMACKASIKAKSKLTEDEALGLIDSWQKCANNAFCPHGRPTFIRLKGEHLEPLFKRR